MVIDKNHTYLYWLIPTYLLGTCATWYLPTFDYDCKIFHKTYIVKAITKQLLLLLLHCTHL